MPLKKPKVKQHTPKERLAMRRHKRKFGPAALRRKERRLPLQPKPPAVEPQTESPTDPETQS